MSYATKLLTAAAAVIMTLASYSVASAADKVKLTMNWTADSAHLGFAVAQTNGIYAAEGLDVELEEGRGSSVAAQMVATGQSELGYADAGAALNVASKGAPIKIISTIWKSGQFGIQYLEKSSIRKPKDLVGKKIAVAPGTAMVPLVPVFLKANGIKDSEVEIVSATQKAGIGMLVSGDVDAVAETPENVVVPLAAEGIKAGNMYFYSNGVPLVSLSLIAREDKLAKNPGVYKRFIKATMKGWQQAMKDPEAAVAALLKVFPDTKKSKSALMQSATYSFASVCPAGSGDSIGVTDAATWDNIYSVMTTAMKFPASRPITSYYSLDYVPADPITCP